MFANNITTLNNEDKNSNEPYPVFGLLLEKRSDYLYACLTAEDLDRAASLDHLAEIAQECADRRLKKLLIERTIAAVAKDTELLSTFSEFIRMSVGVRVAFVGRYDLTQPDLAQLATFNNLGGANFKYFTSVQEAESWLLAA